jgi:teichuronic acid biosynthesis glycosyltransferase TuaG
MLVTIIMPCYNSEKFIEIAIQSVINQTFFLWELIVVDDCSTDNSKKIVEELCKKNTKIKYYRTDFPSGSPTKPRNIGIEKANGQYIAFLDSDDFWEPNKLSSQLKLFDDESVAIAYSNYEKISEEGFLNNRIIIAPNSVNYKELLKGNIIACCTCIYDTSKIGKKYFNKQGHEDYALWLQILKQGFIAKNSGQISAKYRVRKSSISSNKLKTIGWIFTIYRQNEQLSILKSLYYTYITLTKSFFKYIK